MRPNLALTSAFLVLLAVGVAFANDQDPQPPTEPQASTLPDIPENAAELKAIENGEVALPESVPAAAERPLSPMMIEIRGVLAEQQRQVGTLDARFAETTSETAAMAIQQEIEQIKQDAELEILAIQARHARAAGDEDLAQSLDAAIATIQNPPPPPAPTIERPVPVENH
jgi:hypothetical protein